MTNINEILKEANELVPRISIDDAKALLEDINTVILDVREGQEPVSYTHLTLPTTVQV